MINVEAKTDKFFKKLEKDMASFRTGIGAGLKDYAELGFKNIFEKGFIKEGGKPVKKGKYHIKPTHPQANRPNRMGRMTYHKSKIINRDGDLSQNFKSIRWGSESAKGSKITEGKTNENVLLKILDNGKDKILTISLLGKLEQIFKGFENGKFNSKKTVIIDGKEEKTNGRLGQRRVVSNGLRTATNRLNKAIKLGIDKRQGGPI